ncbi:hypothetical protein ACFV1N_30930 [Streptosporangium canum]|uniref:hypothetical protein n=1 Tax=Streptosporangium canum TaxID=324952 RepID=UPI0036828CA2
MSPACHPRIQHAFIPVGACWLNLQEAWWRISPHHALAGVSFACRADLDHATRIATPAQPAGQTLDLGTATTGPRHLRRQFVYSL